MTEEQWYSGKDLYEMMVRLSKGLEKTNTELSKTQIMIRDYNGLRERLAVCEKQLIESHGKEQGKEQGSKSVWGYVVGAFGIASFVFSIVLHFIR